MMQEQEKKGSKKVLIIDDEEQLCKAIKKALEAEGIYEVSMAHTAMDGVEMAERERPDVILLDVDLGKDSGLSITELGKMFNMIIISGKITLSKDLVRQQLHAYGFMEKPLDMKLLHETIDFITDKKHALTPQNIAKAMFNFYTIRLCYDLLRWDTGIFFTPEDMVNAMQDTMFTKEVGDIARAMKKELPPYETVEGLPIGAYAGLYQRWGEFQEYFARKDARTGKKDEKKDKTTKER